MTVPMTRIPFINLAVFLGLSLLPALAGCTQSVPDLTGTAVQLLMVEDAGGGFSERLSVFALWSDDDGPRDFSELRVESVESSLIWTLDPSNASVRLRGKDRWVGSSQLAPPQGESLPRGEYLISVADLSGNESLRRVTVPDVSFPARSPAVFEIQGNEWSLTRNPDSGDFRRAFLFLEDEGGKLLYSWRVPDTTGTHSRGTVAQLKSLAQNAVFARCFIENGTATAGVLLLPVSLE